jgi:hypothetical protein
VGFHQDQGRAAGHHQGEIAGIGHP